MRDLRLADIIELNDKFFSDGTPVIGYHVLRPYLRSLNVYYRDQYCEDLILMLTEVINAVQYGAIVPANQFSEILHEFFPEEDHEIISANSFMLADWLPVNE